MLRSVLWAALASLLLAGCSAMGRPGGDEKIVPMRRASLSGDRSFASAVDSDPFPRAGSSALRTGVNP
jgi:hypothetical protein